MIVEGQADKAPGKVKVILERSDLLIARDAAVEIASKYANKKGWRGGLVGQPLEVLGRVLAKHERPHFAGILGEVASCYHINEQLGFVAAVADLEKRARGDYGFDIAPLGLRIQVKTRQKASMRSLVRVNLAATVPDAFLFAEWFEGEPQRVQLVGWAWKRAVLSSKKEPGIGNWTNYVVWDSSLEPLSRLITELKLRKAQ